MKPYIHAKSSAAKFGGVPDDYIDIHDYMDSSKSSVPDVRHRAIFHSAFGIYIVERVFGTTRLNSDYKRYSVRDIAEQHVQEDLGFIPTMEQWFKGMPIEPWMMGRAGAKVTKSFIPMEDPIPEEGVVNTEFVKDQNVFIDGVNQFRAKGIHYD